jgi:predicted phage terminase large subunit-like protein
LFDPSNPDAKSNRLYAAKQSFYWFCRIYLSHHFRIPMAPFQRELFELAKEYWLMIVMPRGYGKSIVWSNAYPMWVVLNNPYGLDLRWKPEEIVMISNTSTLAEKWIKNIKTELMFNERIQADYRPEKGEIWRVDALDVHMGGQLCGKLVAKGAGAQIRGDHPTEVLIDDLENREEAKSEGPRRNMREYFKQDLLGVLRDEEGAKTRLKIVGTFVHPLALLPELYEEDWWTKRKYAVYKPDGSPLWPEYKDEEKLIDLRRRINSETAWQSEYMNDPIVSEDPTFRREWFKPYTTPEPGFVRGTSGQKQSIRNLYKVCKIDPAISQRDSGDYSAITVYGACFDEPGEIFLLEARRGHWTLSRQISEMLEIHEKYPGTLQIIEAVAYQKALYYEFKERCDRDALNIRVVEEIPDKDKGRRAYAVQPLFQANQVHFDMESPSQNVVMDELVMFDYEVRKHGRDDYVDCTSGCLAHLDMWLRRRRKRRDRDGGKPILMFKTNSPVCVGVE